MESKKLSSFGGIKFGLDSTVLEKNQTGFESQLTRNRSQKTGVLEIWTRYNSTPTGRSVCLLNKQNYDHV